MSSVLCVGDSHTRLIGAKPAETRFRYGRISPTDIRGFDTAHLLSIKGATAAGFNAKNDPRSSFSQAARAIEQLNPDVVCFGFGQVDAELSCYFLALRDDIALDEAVESRLVKLGHYLDACQEASAGRPIVIKGLNTVALNDDSALQTMLSRQIQKWHQVTRRQAFQAIRDLGINLEVHAQINAQIAESLAILATESGLAYFDLRSMTAIAVGQGQSKPEYCAQGVDVHLRSTPEIEVAFSDALSIVAETACSDRPKTEKGRSERNGLHSLSL